MSNYYGYAVNPNTRKVEKAEFLDNYYGSHQYAVRFGDGGTYKESEVQEVEATGKTKSTNPLLSDELKPNYSGKLDLPKIPKKTPQEIKQRIEELTAIIKRGRELEEEYAMNQKADDLLPVFLHLYEQYLGWIEEWNAECKRQGSPSGTYYHRSFDGFMQYLVRRNK